MPAAQQGGGSTRWCPTAEQLMILEEMYRGGLRTPNAGQIQQITAHLALYGRIEGKNVFYWFQNHKARDRQKLRRRLCMTHHLLSACAAHHYYAHAHAHLAPPPPPPHYDHSLVAGYYYPAAAPSPPPPAPLFHYRGGSGGGGACLPAAVGRPEYSLGKLHSFGVAGDVTPGTTPASAAVIDTPPYGSMSPAAMEAAPGEAMSAPAAAPFCRPLKTLDLFPGGLKEEQRDVV